MKHSLVLASLVLVAGLGGTAFAADMATGEQITRAIAGNTVQGSMASSGAYTEFYAVDGTIKGKDYTGKWSVSADKMCFDYGADPAMCWNVSIAGEDVSWIMDGKVEGSGTVVKGNPNNF